MVLYTVLAAFNILTGYRLFFIIVFLTVSVAVMCIMYSSFVSVVIVLNYAFIEIALAVLVVMWLKIDFRGRFLQFADHYLVLAIIMVS